MVNFLWTKKDMTMDDNFGVLINFKGDKDFGVDTGYNSDNDKDFCIVVNNKDELSVTKAK